MHRSNARVASYRSAQGSSPCEKCSYQWRSKSTKLAVPALTKCPRWSCHFLLLRHVLSFLLQFIVRRVHCLSFWTSETWSVCDQVPDIFFCCAYPRRYRALICAGGNIRYTIFTAAKQIDSATCCTCYHPRKSNIKNDNKIYQTAQIWYLTLD